MTAPARRASLRVLRDIHTGRADLPQAQTRVRPTLTDTRDRALMSEIVTGTLRWRAKLDYLIQQASSRPITRIDLDLLDLLRLSVYQILHLKRVPHHAIVNDAVSLARELGKQSAAPFVNAVLRAIASGAPEFGAASLPTVPDPRSLASRCAILDYLTTTLSHPRWLVERWYDRYDFEATQRWADFNNTSAPITLRVNTLVRSAAELAEELNKEGVVTTPGIWASHALIVTKGNPLTTSLASQGLFWPQDETSQLVAELVTARSGDRVLDACASPGGKSLVVANSMADQGLLVSGDVRSKRTALLSNTLLRAGTRCTQVVQIDARRPPFDSIFDWVLLDAPCSGLGTLRRNPDIRWRRTAEDLIKMSKVQSSLLEGVATAVASPGRLVYSTCSSEPEENHEVVQRFLAANSTFEIEPPSNPRLTALLDADGCFQTLPHRDGLQAFFAVILKRKAP